MDLDKTYVRVGGKSRYRWRAVDADGQMVDFHLTAKRAAKATLQGIETIRTIKNG